MSLCKILQVKWSRLKITASAYVGSTEKRAGHFFNADSFSGTRGMNETVVADVHADVADAVAAVGGKENQISFAQLVFCNPAASLKLVARDTGKVKSVQPVTDHGQAATVKTVIVVGTTPSVRDTEEAAGCFDQFFPQGGGVNALESGGGIRLGDDDEKTADKPLGPQLFSLIAGRRIVGVVPEPDFKQPGLMAEVIGVDSAIFERLFQSHRIFQVGKRTYLNSIAHFFKASDVFMLQGSSGELFSVDGLLICLCSPGVIRTGDQRQDCHAAYKASSYCFLKNVDRCHSFLHVGPG